MRFFCLIVALLLIALATVLLMRSDKRVRGVIGYWHIEKDDRNVWWFVSPNGNKEFLNNVTSIQPYQESRDPSSKIFRSKDYNDDIELWAEKTANRVIGAGFKGSGAWSHQSIGKYIPYARDLNLMLHCHVPISDPLWVEQIEEAIKSQVVPLKYDKNLIGYYLDNELDWETLSPYADKYFSTICDLVRKYDPNHLILGVRFNQRPPPQVLLASSGKVDVHSVHVYSDDAQAYKYMVRDLWTLGNAPVIVSEFTFYSLDNDSGNLNTKGWGGNQINRYERARAYRNFVCGMAGTSFVIGTDWFQWNDEPPAGRSVDGEDMNVGFVTVDDQPYDMMYAANRAVRDTVNSIHEKSDDSQQSNVWAIDPVHYVKKEKSQSPK